MAIKRPTRRGTYAPLFAQYYLDEKVLAVGQDAELLYVRSLAFCAGSMSDGFMSDRQAMSFARSVRSFRRSSAELVQVGLWQRAVDGRGFWVTAWLKWNPSAEAIRKAQAQDAARKRAKKSARIPDGRPGDSARIPNGFRPTNTDTDTEFSDRTPPGSVRSETRAGRSRAPQAAPRPAERLLVVNAAGTPPDLSEVRAQLASASAAVHARAARRPDAFGELRRLVVDDVDKGPRGPQGESGGSE